MCAVSAWLINPKPNPFPRGYPFPRGFARAKAKLLAPAAAAESMDKPTAAQPVTPDGAQRSLRGHSSMTLVRRKNSFHLLWCNVWEARLQVRELGIQVGRLGWHRLDVDNLHRREGWTNVDPRPFSSVRAQVEIHFGPSRWLRALWTPVPSTAASGSAHQCRLDGDMAARLLHVAEKTR